MARTNIPKNAKKIAPKEQEKDSQTGKLNWASNPETVKRFLQQAYDNFIIFDAQGARSKMLERINKADQMMRMAQDQTKEGQNKTEDGTDNVPHIFFTTIRLMNAIEADVLFRPDDPIGKFIPLDSLDEVNKREAKRVTEDRERLFEYSCEADDLLTKLKNNHFFKQKYGNSLISAEWFEETREEQMRVAQTDADGTILMDDNTGLPSKVEKKTVTTTEAHPTVNTFSLDHVWMDASLDDIQEQQALLIRWFPGRNDLLKEQKAGRYINVGNIGEGQLYRSEDPSYAKSQRQANAGETRDTNNETGRYEGWVIWQLAPINDKGEWDDKDTEPTWQLGVFVGDFRNGAEAHKAAKDTKTTKAAGKKPDGEQAAAGAGGTIAVRGIPNPYNDKMLPYFMGHSHRDDKGMYHMGYADVMEAVYNQYKTTLDQWFYNKNRMNAAPWKTEHGAIYTTDKDFSSPRKLIEMHVGQYDKLEQVQVTDNTTNSIQFLAYLEDTTNTIMGTEKPVRGVASGGRTSAAEFKGISDQSLKPIVEKLRYESDEEKWIAERFEGLWEQFASSELAIAVTRDDVVREIKPAFLHGRIRYKVKAVEEFERDLLQRQEQDRFLQVMLPSAQLLGKKSFLALIRGIFKKRKLGLDLVEIFGMVKETDAHHVARDENEKMMPVKQPPDTPGVWDEPKQGEDHDIHLADHESHIRLYKLLPNALPENVKLGDTHIEMHKQMKEQEAATLKAGAEQAKGALGLGGGATPPGTEGEALDDLQGAAEGVTSQG